MPLTPLNAFRPHPLFRNPHLQTIAFSGGFDKRGIRFDRHRLETADGDFLDVDVPTVEGLPVATDAPTVLVVHGLGGEARGGYMHDTYREMARVGLRTVGLNLRGCSGEPNRLARSYHLGATDDLPVVLRWIQTRYPGFVGLMGFSLGANLTLKLAGELGEAMRGLAQAAVAISPPFALGGRMRLNDFPNQIYRTYLLRGLRDIAARKATLIDAAGGDSQRAIHARTLEAYDRACTAPINGFSDEQDYYRKTSCGQFLHGIAIPTLVIRSTDDPFFYDDVPHEALAANPSITALITAHGGHCGFLEGLPPRLRSWAHPTAAAWMKTQLRV